jgi:MerR family redox-sensitive transcriptional activator SoxR
MSSNDDLAIGELARRTARRPSAIRYYEQIGLLPRSRRVNGRRRYPEETVRTLSVVDTAQRAGLTLDEIRALLAAEPSSPAAVEELRRIAEQRLPELDAMIERAQVLRRWLAAAESCECPNLDECCLFEPGAPLPPSGRS